MYRRKCQLDRDDAEFYDKFHPTVKDVEANAERERRKILGKDPKQVSRSLFV
jgi:hypothetical protein